MGERIPLMRTRVATAVSTGAWHREVFQLPGLDLSTPHQPDVRPWPDVPHGHHPSGGKLRDHRPRAAFLDRLQVHASAGNAAATPRTVRAAEARATRRSRGGRRPRPRHDGMRVAGRSCQTRVWWGTSATYHRPSPATPSRKLGWSPKRLVRHHPTPPHTWLLTTPVSISWAHSGVVLNVRSGGKPHGRRRLASASSVHHAAGPDNRRSSTV